MSSLTRRFEFNSSQVLCYYYCFQCVLVSLFYAWTYNDDSFLQYLFSFIIRKSECIKLILYPSIYQNTLSEKEFWLRNFARSEFSDSIFSINKSSSSSTKCNLTVDRSHRKVGTTKLVVVVMLVLLIHHNGSIDGDDTIENGEECIVSQ